MLFDVPPPLAAVAVPAQVRKAKYHRLFRRQPATWRRWAHNTSQCESHQIATIHDPSGTYHGAFQFALGTWASISGQAADPHTRSWGEQGYYAIRLARTGGTGHWPICG